MKEPEVHHMLPITKRLIEEDIERRKQNVGGISKIGHEIWAGGDQWHSSTFRAQQQVKDTAISIFMMAARRASGAIESWPKPTQTETVEAGHMVKVKLLDDEDITRARIEHTVVHVFGQEDALYLGDRFDRLRQMIVANVSALGKALVGRRRGDTVPYLPDQRLQVLNTDDAIKVSTLFDDET